MLALLLLAASAGAAAASPGLPRLLDDECGPGLYLNDTSCALCPEGTWKDAAGDDESLCQDCPAHDSESTADRVTCACDEGAFADTADGYLCVDAALLVSTQPASAVVGAALGVQPVVSLLDADLAPVDAVAGSVTATLLQDGAAVSPAAGGAAALVDGVATFAGLEFAAGGAGFSLLFSLDNAAGVEAQSDDFQVWFADVVAACDEAGELVDAGGECCAGSIDACGVCDGSGDTCALLALLAQELPADTEDALAASSAARATFLAGFCADVEAALALTAGRCEAAAFPDAPDYSRVQLTFAPPSGFEADMATIQEELLLAAQSPDSALLAGNTTQYLDTAVAPQVWRAGVCANGQCETGETDESCPEDCTVANVAADDDGDDDDDFDLTFILIIAPIAGVVVLYCIIMRYCIHKRNRSGKRTREDAQGVLMRLNNPRFAASTHGRPGEFRETRI